MNNNLQELVFVLDHSSSVDKYIKDATSGLKTLLAQQASLPGDTNVTLALFGGEYKMMMNAVSIKKAKLDEKAIKIAGVCPFIDSAVHTVNEVGKRLSDTLEQNRPSKVIVVMVVLGRDNASKKHTYAELSEIIRRQTEVYKWKFYLVTDFSIIMEKLGLPEEDTILIKRGVPGGFSDAYRELGEKVSELRAGLTV